MDFKVGLLICLMLIGGWACEARLFTATDVPGLDERNGKEDACTLCLEYSTLAIEYLSEQKTQQEILDALHDTCSQMHTLKNQCIKLVDYYATHIFTEVISVKPEELCKKINVCQATKHAFLKVKDNKCYACHHAIDEVIAKLKDPDTKLEVIEILLKLCNVIDKDHVKQCKSTVFEYGPIMLANAEKFLEKTDICSTFHACSPSKTMRDVASEGMIKMVTSS